MAIVFACPKCQFVMKAPEDQGGVKVKCMQCSVTLEIPYLRGILVDVPPEQAVAVLSGGSAIKPTQPTHQAMRAAPKENRADEWLKEASELKEQDNHEAAIKLLRRAYEEIRRENAMFPVDAFLKLPIYLQNAGKMKDAWVEFTNLLFRGYPNQPRHGAPLFHDRAKIMDTMRLFLDHERRADVADVYGILGTVCKGVALHKEDRKKELRAFLNKSTCEEYVAELKKYPGNLGPLQPIHTAVIEELSRFPDVDYDRLGDRIDRGLTVKT
ncbi:MAG: hypothetical protein JNM56_37675 [Planctomycetia bacterium]|nr:hypothetical protein [Planctomycetia bacterium]